MRINDLKARISRAEYAVDPTLVAAALLRQATARRVVLAPPAVSRRGARSPRGSAPRRPL